MSTIRLKPEQLGPALQARARADVRAMLVASRRASHRLRAHMIADVERLGITDTGLYRNSFRVVQMRTGSGVENEAPHAGVIELGARPHVVSRAGVEAIARWVRRKLRKSGPEARMVKRRSYTKYGADEALRIAYAIAKKIEREGQKGHHVFERALPQARAFFRDELNAILRTKGAKPRSRR